MSRWFLECLVGEGEQIERLPLKEFPLIVGRSENVELTLDSTDVSRRHAEIVAQDGGLLVRDMGSTNGTFVNHHRISQPTVLRSGDVVHFAHVEARLVDDDESKKKVSTATIVMEGNLSNKIPLGSRDLKALLQHEQVTVVYQPIVDTSGQHVAYEMLGRGNHPDLLPSPGALFKIAESIDKAVELSEMFRKIGLHDADRLGLKQPLFMNTHPHEMKDQDRLLKSIEWARKKYPELKLVLEIHEQAVTDIIEMQKLGHAIRAMGLGLAYDDFGAGQARLLELTEAPPNVVKFDIALIRNIHKGGKQKQEMLEILVSLVHKMGIKALAEGASLMEEVEICHKVGFDLIQGFAYGYPLPLSEWMAHG